MGDIAYVWLLVAHQYARGLRAFAQAASDRLGKGEAGREGAVCGTAQRWPHDTGQSVSTSSGRPRPLIGGSGSAGHTRQRPAA